MKTRINLWWEQVRASYGFTPTLMIVAGAAFALMMISLDQRVTLNDILVQEDWWLFTGGAEGARTLLSTVAGSVITVAGVVFSITIAVLSLTASQFGPRLLRGFLQDRGSQMVLGTFLGTFLYCLLVLRTVRSIEERLFIPHLAVTGGVVLAIACVAMLVYYIHHVSSSLQVSRLIAQVGGEINESITCLFPKTLGNDVPEPLPPVPFSPLPEEMLIVTASGSGYVQTVNDDALIALAVEYDACVLLLRQPGDFVMTEMPLAQVWLAPDCPKARKAFTDAIRRAITLGRQRTPAQDFLFPVRQLVEMATRALSPGINDPFTAVMCLDSLGDALCRLMNRKLPSPLRYDGQKTLRLVTTPLTFDLAADTAFDTIRHYGCADALVMGRMMEILRDLSACARNDAQRETLRRHLRRTRTAINAGIADTEVRNALEHAAAAAPVSLPAMFDKKEAP